MDNEIKVLAGLTVVAVIVMAIGIYSMEINSIKRAKYGVYKRCLWEHTPIECDYVYDKLDIDK